MLTHQIDSSSSTIRLSSIQALRPTKCRLPRKVSIRRQLMRPEKPGVMAVRCRADGFRSTGWLLCGSRTMVDIASQDLPGRSVDEIDSARAREYALLATLLSHSPDAQLLSVLAGLHGDTSPIGLAHTALAEAARRATEERVAREYFALFAGLQDGALLPYASHYLTDTLYGRPLGATSRGAPTSRRREGARAS